MLRHSYGGILGQSRSEREERARTPGARRFPRLHCCRHLCLGHAGARQRRCPQARQLLLGATRVGEALEETHTRGAGRGSVTGTREQKNIARQR